MAKQVSLIDKNDYKSLLNRLKFIETRIDHDEIATALTEINELISIVEERLGEDVRN